ncbi:TPA: histidine kinase, partial [Enterococcus faecium]|nr:histidine kinase [Enterococcus faecium]HCR2816548.1 histidine kinase [Enterococcus faecium]HCR2822441.1 histidine kinase [Enterococcus faecium]
KKSVIIYMTFCLKRRLSIKRPFGLNPCI